MTFAIGGSPGSHASYFPSFHPPAPPLYFRRWSSAVVADAARRSEESPSSSG
jgi:hypothetical protein